MNISWSKQAAESLRDTTAYVRKEFGIKAKQKLLDEVRSIVKQLPNNPCLGKVEPLLEEASVEYRSLVVNRLNKIVYFINTETETIEIVALWDTRREPKKQASRLK
jgi:plasmid stabilization system protein ParE